MHDGIVIGEGVLLDARPAGFISRTLAVLLDLIALFVVIVLLLVLAVPWLTDQFLRGEAGFDALLITNVLVTITVMVGVPTTVETLTRGRSLGKLAAGIRVVRDDGGPIRFRHAFVRALVGIFELWLTVGFLAVITSLINRRGKRLGDLAAGSYVVRVRGGHPPSAPVVMPPELATWADTTDMRRLPDGLALAARQFLGRAHKLAPQSRLRVADDLAGRVEPYVAPGPPAGTHPEAFLHAVLAERRLREEDAARLRQSRADEHASLLHRLPYAVPDLRD
ncbi:RDD family protein [Myceligenerans pegani]|uniref:RDD family protein n=1 Tax=Myceligenerans pegani TaxID=2776917 RepID=A0ABR9N006_9MICO|nr:RDD family protein [Myceligenerans sp. TRM 65318]MBE1876352.1 RDD family protein [Myceligenerans sp. TRM 65318]MBE3018623.1 RDD family protein [Myceligenerans sp. TRM 65318]